MIFTSGVILKVVYTLSNYDIWLRDIYPRRNKILFLQNQHHETSSLCLEIKCSTKIYHLIWQLITSHIHSRADDESLTHAIFEYSQHFKRGLYHLHPLIRIFSMLPAYTQIWIIFGGRIVLRTHRSLSMDNLVSLENEE